MGDRNVGYRGAMIHLARTINYDTCVIHDKLYKSSLAIGIIDLLAGLFIIVCTIINRSNIIKNIRANIPIDTINKEGLDKLLIIAGIYNTICCNILIILAIVTTPVYNNYNPDGCNVHLYTMGFVSMYVLYPIGLASILALIILSYTFCILAYLCSKLYICMCNLQDVYNLFCGCYYTVDPGLETHVEDCVIIITDIPNDDTIKLEHRVYNTECPISLSSPANTVYTEL